MAMLDAVELARCLSGSSYPDALSAIAAYEKEMLTRFAEIAEITMQSTAASHAADAIKFLIDVIS